jgi:hypothetical protein
VVHLRAHDITGGPGWLIDMLALTRMRLQTDALPDQAPDKRRQRNIRGR